VEAEIHLVPERIIVQGEPALGNRLDQRDPSPWRGALTHRHTIGRAGGQAEPAVHAGVDNIPGGRIRAAETREPLRLNRRLSPPRFYICSESVITPGQSPTSQARTGPG